MRYSPPMAWFKKVRKPIESGNKESRVPEGLWVKCPSCAQIIYNKDLAASLSVCTKCSHHFPLSDGLSRQTIERHAEEFERAVAEQSKALERQLVAEKEKALSKFRDEELQLRRRLRELEEADKNRDVDYQRKLDEERRRIDAQYKVQLESAQREAADLKRKLEQGSQQTQGEALEVGVEAMLKAAFPMDEPKYLVMVLIFEPKGTEAAAGEVLAGRNAAPTAGRVIARIVAP